MKTGINFPSLYQHPFRKHKHGMCNGYILCLCTNAQWGGNKIKRHFNLNDLFDFINNYSS